MAKQPTTKKTVDLTKPRPALKVICAQPGFRRGGIAFGPEPTTVPLDELSDEQIELIKNEPKLVVIDAVIEPEPEPKADGATKT